MKKIILNHVIQLFYLKSLSFKILKNTKSDATDFVHCFRYPSNEAHKTKIKT